MTRLRREWKCNYCNCVFDSSTKLRNHKKEEHSEECKNHIFKLNLSKRNPNGWVCNYCGEKYDSKRLLYEHIHELHPENCFWQKTNTKQWICKYCNLIFNTRNELFEHYKSCDEKLKLPHDSKGRVISEVAHKHAGETLSKKYATGELKYIAHPCSADLRAKLATNMQERHQIINFQCNYNETACKFIDELNIKNNWHLQHALNGGEIRIGPYSLDGYDKDLNIVFEYDENKSKHNSLKGQLKDKYRQLYIMEKLKCKFWRYSEKHNLLYEATIEQTKIDIEKLEKIIV